MRDVAIAAGLVWSQQISELRWGGGSGPRNSDDHLEGGKEREDACDVRGALMRHAKDDDERE